MTTDLFGDPIPQSEMEIVRAFVASVKRRGHDSFNSFRHRHGIDCVSKHIGSIVRAACERAGLICDGTEHAALPASHGRLCAMWRVAE